MTIEHEIAAWDGKSVSVIKAVYDSYHLHRDFIDTLIDLSASSQNEKGATWLLKAWLEVGNKLEPNHVHDIYSLLNKFEYWEAKLHVLQCIPFMPISKTDRDTVYNFLRVTLTDQNKFVRAWSYNGLYELSVQHSKYLNKTKQIFETGKRDEAASVKARIRNIERRGF